MVPICILTKPDVSRNSSIEYKTMTINAIALQHYHTSLNPVLTLKPPSSSIDFPKFLRRHCKSIYSYCNWFSIQLARCCIDFWNILFNNCNENIVTWSVEWLRLIFNPVGASSSNNFPQKRCHLPNNRKKTNSGLCNATLTTGSSTVKPRVHVKFDKSSVAPSESAAKLVESPPASTESSMFAQ